MVVTLDPPFVDRASSTRPTKTIAVLGAAYGGARAAKLISDSLPEGWKLVVVERNSHFNHVYAFPRYSVVPKHAPKAFIPYINHLKLTTPPAKIDATKSLPTPPLTPTSSTEDLNEKKYYDARVWIQGSITKLTPHSVTFTRPSRSIAPGSSEHSNVETGSGRGHGVFDGPEETIHFDYAIYALGAGLPDPSNVWNEHPGNNPPKEVVHDHVEHGLGSKRHGVKWMQHRGEMYEKAGKILIVGGGALGIQLASDIKYSYPDKDVTLLHSRERLLPIYPIEMHDQLLAGLKRLQVNVVLGQRVTEWPEDPEVLDGAVKVTRTNKGSVFESDLVLPCTGQKPHSQLMGSISPAFLSEKNCRIRVTPTLQITSDPAKSVNPDSIVDPLEIVRRLDALSLSHSTPPSSPASSSRNRENDDGAEREIDMSHFFAVGDCADTGAIQAGHTAYWQGEAAARNILRLIKKEESGGKIDEPLEVYKSGAPAIKVTMGLDRGIISNAEGTKESMDAHEDLNARLIWDSKGSSHLPDDA